MTSQRFSGHASLIVGATGGVGRAVARQMAAQGASRLFLTGRDGGALSTFAAELGAVACGIPLDVTSAASIDAMAEQVSRVDLSLSSVIYAAGSYEYAPLDQLTPSMWQRSLDTNLTGAYLVVRALLPELVSGSSLVLVASAAAIRGSSEGHAHYGAAKAGLVGFGRSLARELAPRGIRVNAVAPTLIRKTAMGDTEFARRAETELGTTPLGRLAAPSEIAMAIAFLASSESSFISGACLPIAGGEPL